MAEDILLQIKKIKKLKTHVRALFSIGWALFK